MGKEEAMIDKAAREVINKWLMERDHYGTLHRPGTDEVLSALYMAGYVVRPRHDMPLPPPPKDF